MIILRRHSPACFTLHTVLWSASVFTLRISASCSSLIWQCCFHYEIVSLFLPRSRFPIFNEVPAASHVLAFFPSQLPWRRNSKLAGLSDQAWVNLSQHSPRFTLHAALLICQRESLSRSASLVARLLLPSPRPLKSERMHAALLICRCVIHTNHQYPSSNEWFDLFRQIEEKAVNMTIADSFRLLMLLGHAHGGWLLSLQKQESSTPKWILSCL